ncbi:SMC5-SMC6 complex localization factor protein 2 isoform X3 [Triplophysa dalaica]|uniref:SMC5-SMC6 complex localization factor protein 2 isoform X3 n=1 Tax=Triplophysa dalaica TaxID=1582913 RepID=UPI0024E03897|nr:SMC5-SMC6 complex localization factor protein 2 isoform X3 [Triplophysa dalaica]
MFGPHPPAITTLETWITVKELIPLGIQRRQSSDGTSRPASVRPCLEPPEKSPKVSSTQLKPVLPVKNSELGRRESKVFNKSHKTELDKLSNCSVVMRKLQANSGNIYPCKDGSLSPMPKKDLQRTSSYKRDRDISLALSKELNENLRLNKCKLPPIDVKSRRHTLPQPSHSRPYSSCLVQERPRSSVSTAQRIHRHPDQRKDRMERSDHKTSIYSNMSNRKESSPPHGKPSPEGRESLSGKRKRESSTGSEKDLKRPCVDARLTPSLTPVMNSPPKFVKRAFLNSVNESMITIKDKLTPKPLSQTSDPHKPRPLPSISSKLFKQETGSNSNTESDKIHVFQPTKQPKEAMVAHANKNPQTPPSQPHLRKISPKSSTTFDSIEGLFTPDPCLPAPKTHSKISNSKISNTEREDNATPTHKSSLPSLKESVKISLSPGRPDLRTPSFAGHAGSCKMESDDRTELKVEQSRSPKANMLVPAASVKVEGSSEKKRSPKWKDPLDIELGDDSEDDLRESCIINLSSSDEDEQLPSLREIMDWRTCEPVTPEKDAFSEPSTPVPKAKAKAAPVAVKAKTNAVSYRNTLEQMLQEKEQYQRSKELERQLLESCQEDLLNLNEDENSDAKEEDISLEQREFLQKFSVASCAIREIHPGEEIFTPAKFGRLFNHLTLDLRKISVTPQNRSQHIFLQARTEQVLFLISAGLLRTAYISFPCQPEVTLWLFQMMSVHPNPITSSRILDSLRSIALSAAEHIVENPNTENQTQRFKVWVPTLQDIALVFLNVGASFISLFPLEALQPPFTEGDLLECFQPEETSHGTRISDKANDTLPAHNFENVLRYLSLCTSLCPRAYTDEELLLLVTVVCRIGLETHFQLLPIGHFTLLLKNLLKNITHWDIQLSKACETLSDLSEDHHNLRRLVYLLPDGSRGKQLKQHLSVSIISKLLNHTCTYKPSSTEFKLSALKPFLPHMRPSSLVKALRSSKSTEHCHATLDQQAYYLCYSLLTLTNEASNFEFLPSIQRNELRSLSSQLEKHIKCDIRESEKTLYRSKVKDFVARIYTRWQVLLVRTRPQEGKLYDYWKPLPEDEIPNSPQGKTCLRAQDTSDNAEETQTRDMNSAQPEEDAESKEQEEKQRAEEHEDPEGSEDVAQGHDERTDNHREVEEQSNEATQQPVEQNDVDEKLKEMPDEKQLGSFEELMESDEDLMRRMVELLNEDEEPCKDRRYVEENNRELEELENLLENDEELFDESNKGRDVGGDVNGLGGV